MTAACSIGAWGRNQLLYYKNLKRGTLELTNANGVALDALLAGRTVRISQLYPAAAARPDATTDAMRGELCGFGALLGWSVGAVLVVGPWWPHTGVRAVRRWPNSGVRRSGDSA